MTITMELVILSNASTDAMEPIHSITITMVSLMRMIGMTITMEFSKAQSTTPKEPIHGTSVPTDMLSQTQYILGLGLL